MPVNIKANITFNNVAIKEIINGADESPIALKAFAK